MKSESQRREEYLRGELPLLLLINRISKTFHREMRKVCEENRVPVGYRSLLFHLGHHNECSQKELVEKTELKSSTVSIALDKMERDGYIERRRDGKDGRVILVCLTDKGKEINRKNKEKVDVLEQQFAATVTAEEEKELARLLTKLLRGYFDQQGWGDPFAPEERLIRESCQERNEESDL